MDPIESSAPAATPSPAPAPSPSSSAPSAASPAPASEPLAASEPVPAGTNTSFDAWQDEAIPGLEALVTPMASAEVAAPPIAPAAATAPAVAPAVVQPPPAAGQPAPQPAAAPAVGGGIPPGPQDVLGDLAKNRNAIITALAQEHFQISEKEAEAFAADPGRNAATLAARVYYEASVNTIRQIQSVMKQMPAMVLGIIRAASDNSSLETKFYEKFPDLKGKDADIVAISSAIRTQRPGLKQDEFLDLVGRTLRGMHGTAANVMATPQSAPAPVPFRPAPAGVPVVASQVLDPFAGMGMDFGDDGV